MTSVRIMIQLVFLSMLAASFRCCNATISFYNDLGPVWSCDSRADNLSTATFKANVNGLLKTLNNEGPENYGFYVNTTGNSSDKIYGLVQCMGDISAKDCASCIKDSIKWARENCRNSNDVAVWLYRCFLRYSEGNFLGQWNTSSTGITYNSSSRADSPSVAARGRDLLQLLSLDVPSQPFLFKTGSVDAGKQGTRHGLVQCNRDLNESSCGYCLDHMLDFYFTYIGNESSYMAISYGCRMWYDRYQFYFNDTVPSIVPTSLVESTNSGMHLQISFAATLAALVTIFVIGSSF